MAVEDGGSVGRRKAFEYLGCGMRGNVLLERYCRGFRREDNG